MNRIHSKLLLLLVLVVAVAALTVPGTAAAGWTWDGAALTPDDATAASDVVSSAV